VRWLAWFALAIACSFVWHPSRLKADGAFADSQTILLPRTQPHRIIASSDISGLLVSDDDGASWSWICDAAMGYFAALFQLGPAPDENLYAITQAGLAISLDEGCSWQHAAGIAQRAADVFPHPQDPQSVLLVAQVALETDNHVFSDVVARSHDAGMTFGSPMFATSLASITGVEIARSDPNAIYLTLSSLQLQHPYLARSNDAGETWAEFDLTGQLGNRPMVIRILAVDPLDANTLYIRLSDGIRDALAITRDAGATMQIALQLDASMTAFLLRSDAALIVAGADAKSFISTDAGATFSAWSNEFHIHALAEKAGALYATASSKVDGFSVAVSTDAGDHWRPLLRLDQLRGPISCGSVADQCQAPWTQLQPSLGVLSGKPREAAGSPALDGEPVLAGGRDEARHGGGGCSIGMASGGSPVGMAGTLAAAALSAGTLAVRRALRGGRPGARRRLEASTRQGFVC
jgi:hypothetical protein